MENRMKRALAMLLGVVLASSGVVAVAISSPAQAAPAVAHQGIRKPVTAPGEYIAGKPTAATEQAARQRVASGQRAALTTPCPNVPAVCYHYAESFRDLTTATNTGATQVAALVSQHKPYRPSDTFHTLWEMAVVDRFNAGGRNIIEAGWNVDQSVNGDNNPHFFVFSWVNDVAGCYNGCGWVDNPNENAVNAGTSLAYTATGVVPSAYYQYRIERVSSPSWCTGTCGTPAGFGTGWQIVQKNQGAADRIIGGFKDTTWTAAGTSFTAVPQYQFFWEVASNDVEVCGDMGAGTYGSGTLPHTSADLLAASNNYAGNDWDAVDVDPVGDSPSAFRVFDGAGYATPDTDRIRGGGPGWNAAGTGAGSVGSC